MTRIAIALGLASILAIVTGMVGVVHTGQAGFAFVSLGGFAGLCAADTLLGE